MKKSFLVYVTKMLAGLGTFAVSAILGGTYAYTGKFLEAAIFWIIAIVFGLIGLNYSCLITIDETGVRKSIFGKTLRFLPWSQIQEVGIVGTKVFGGSEDQTGTRFLYFSPVTMTEEERFNMVLKWPPKEQIYLEYGREQLELVRMLYYGTIETYRAGDAFY